jgi:predicted nucleotidyltransferase
MTAEFRHDDETIRELVRRIREAVEPERIILFGSAARGDVRPDSDIDVLVILQRGRRRLRASQKIHMNLYGFSTPVDVVVTTSTSLEKHKDNRGLIYKYALQDGREIYPA